MPSPDRSSRLPRIVDALKLCQQRAHITGLVELAQLPRLVGVLSEPDGHVLVNIDFAIDEQHRKVLTGHVEATLPLTCQRCLGRLSWQLDTGFNLALVWDEEQVAQLPRTLDPVLVENTEIDVFGIVEDEILLALPLVAHHDIGTCFAPPVTQPEVGTDAGEARKNPFQVLASLKTGGPSRNESGE